MIGYRMSSRAVLLSERDQALARVLESIELSRKNPEIVALTRNKHYVGVRPAGATAATARVAASVLWNPHSTSRIQVFEAWCFPTTAGSVNLSVTRATARGTASTTVSMNAGNSISNDTAAPSACVVDTAWSVAPTIAAYDMIRAITPAAIGNGLFLSFPDPIDITPTSGLAMITSVTAAFPISDITWVIGD